jgi:hypothetical protein
MQQWQDYVLATGSLLFTLALIPSLRAKNKPALSTSLITVVVLVIFALTYITLSLWFSAAAAGLNGLAWLALALQKHRQKIT